MADRDPNALTERERETVDAYSAHLGVPVHSGRPPNEANFVRESGPRSPEDFLRILAQAEKRAEKDEKPGVFAIVSSMGAINSLFSAESFNDEGTASLLNRLADAGKLDLRAQIRLESLFVGREGRQYTPSFSGLSLADQLIAADMDDAGQWGRLIAEPPRVLPVPMCRAFVKLGAPFLIQTDFEAAAQTLPAAIDSALKSMSATALPKASAPTPITAQQRALERLVERCEQLAKLCAKTEAALPTVSGAKSTTRPLVEWRPESLKRASEAFAAKHAALLKKSEAGLASNEASPENGHGSGSANSGAKAPAKKTARGAPEPFFTPSPQGALRRQAMLEAANNVDSEHFEWLLQSLPGAAWVQYLDKKADSAGNVLDRLSFPCAHPQEPHEVQGVQFPARSRRESSAFAGRMLRRLVDTGLDLVAEATLSHWKADNPFWRARAVLAPRDPAGELTGAWLEELTKQMRHQGISLPDATALLEEALARSPQYLYKNHPDGAPFAQVARSQLEAWHLRAEMESVKTAPRVSVENDTSSDAKAGLGSNDQPGSPASRPVRQASNDPSGTTDLFAPVEPEMAPSPQSSTPPRRSRL